MSKVSSTAVRDEGLSMKGKVQSKVQIGKVMIGEHAVSTARTFPAPILLVLASCCISPSSAPSNTAGIIQ